MIEFIGFLIVMGLLDSLNPFSIGVQIVILPVVKKISHVIYYIVGIFVTYFIGGVAIFAGIDTLLKQWFVDINFSEWPFPYIGLILGTGLLVFAIFKIFKSNGIKANPKEFSVHPVALLFLGVSGTAMDLPTGFPYLAVLAKGIEIQFAVLQIAPLLALYCFIYVLPLIIIQLSYGALHEKISPALHGIKIWLERANRFIIIILSTITSLFLIITSILSFVR